MRRLPLHRQGIARDRFNRSSLVLCFGRSCYKHASDIFGSSPRFESKGGAAFHERATFVLLEWP